MASFFERYVWLSRYMPLLLWIGVIFFLSSGQGAATETSRIIRPILLYLFPAASAETITFYHGIVRKFAHLFEYAVLGVLACRAFVSLTRAYVLAWLLVLLVAVLDETNQSFNPQRTGSSLDVGIDLLGGTVAVFLFYLLRKK